MDAYGYILNKVFIKLKPSRIAGIGAFALKDIPINTKLFEPWTGSTGTYSITEDQMLSFPKELYKHIKEVFTFGPDFPTKSDTFVYLINGCHWIYTTPYYFVNSGGDKFNMDKDSLTSTSFIKQGSEILSNYGRYERTNRNLL